MEQVLSLLVAAVILAVIGSVLYWLGGRIRRRGVGSDLMGPAEEIWYATARSSRFVIQEQNELRVQIPAPDDK
jgi:hypothetical protein